MYGKCIYVHDQLQCLLCFLAFNSQLNFLVHFITRGLHGQTDCAWEWAGIRAYDIWVCVCTYGCIIYICNGDISPDICSYIMRVVVYPYGPTCRPGFKIRHSSWNFGSSVRRQGSPENWRWDGNGESKDRHYQKSLEKRSTCGIYGNMHMHARL